MNRRQYAATVGSILTGMAGCLDQGGASTDAPPSETPTSGSDETPTEGATPDQGGTKLDDSQVDNYASQIERKQISGPRMMPQGSVIESTVQGMWDEKISYDAMFFNYSGKEYLSGQDLVYEGDMPEELLNVVDDRDLGQGANIKGGDDDDRGISILGTNPFLKDDFDFDYDKVPQSAMNAAFRYNVAQFESEDNGFTRERNTEDGSWVYSHDDNYAVHLPQNTNLIITKWNETGLHRELNEGMDDLKQTVVPRQKEKGGSPTKSWIEDGDTPTNKDEEGSRYTSGEEVAMELAQEAVGGDCTIFKKEENNICLPSDN